MRGAMMSGSGNQDRRYPEASGPRGKRKGKAKRKGRGKRSRRGPGPLHEAMVRAAT